ncbi:TPA: hypothetical protein U1V53_001528 [Streptococcus suis]|nr:hypothetical protein [Streptococcus suis]HEM3954203.1 hypothetical protein [Streptococcus suis]
MKKAHFRDAYAKICIENDLKFDIITIETKKAPNRCAKLSTDKALF